MINFLNFLIIGGYVSFIINLSIGLFVYFQNRKNSINVFFCLFSLTIALWSVGSSLLNTIPDKHIAIFILRCCYFFAIILPPIYLHFIYLVTDQRGKRSKIFIIFYLVSLIFIFFLFSQFFIKGLKAVGRYGLLISDPGIAYYLFIGFFGVGTFLGLSVLYRAIKVSAGQRHNQLKYMFTAQLVALLAGCDYFASVLGIKKYPPLDDYILVIYFGIMAFAILKYRLLDINLALTRAGIFAAVYFFVLGLPFWLGYITKTWWPSTTLAVFLATFGPLIYNTLRRQAEAKLLAEDLKKYETLKRFARTLGLIKDLDKLLKLIVYRLVKTLKLTYGAIYLWEEEEGRYLLRSSYGPQKAASLYISDIPDKSSFIQFLNRWKKDILLEDLSRLIQEKSSDYPSSAHNHIDLKAAFSQMQRLNVSLVIPHFLENTLTGFLILGPKLSGRHYSESDIDVLTTLSRAATLAIDNALFMLDLKKTEAELADTHRVAQLGYLASATGHQLSNVLNNIVHAGYAVLDSENVLNSFEANPQAKEELQKALNDIITNARDGGLIIDELRDYAQSERDKKFSPVNLKEVLDKALNVLYIQAHKFQNIDIAVNIASDAPLVWGSFVGLQNVFVNMFNNAYDAILEKKNYLKANPESGTADYKGRIEVNISRAKGNVHIHIIDDGKGMTPDVLKRLFTPLYTTKASSQKRQEKKLTGGTGIGLYAILVIIKNHGGTIKVEKTENLKGTDFLIQLPVSKEEG